MGCEENEEQKKKEGFFWKPHFWFFEKWRENQNMVVLVLGEKRFSRLEVFCVLVFRFREGGTG